MLGMGRGIPQPRPSTRVDSEDEVLERIRAMVGNGIGYSDCATTQPSWPPQAVARWSCRPTASSTASTWTCRWEVPLTWVEGPDGRPERPGGHGSFPLGALVSLCVPGGSGDGEVALGVMAGVAEASAATRCPVVGGDVRRRASWWWPSPCWGRSVGRGGGVAVRRLARRRVLVTGPCGASAAGLRAASGGHRVGGDRLPPAGGPPARGRAWRGGQGRTP